MTRAFITGITGQDGSYLADQLLDEGHQVFGLIRRNEPAAHWRIAHLGERITLIHGDLLDLSSLIRAVEQAEPTRIFHLAAQSFVGRSWTEPEHTAQVTGLGTLRMLEAMRIAAPQARFFQPSTSEMYGNSSSVLTPSGPFSPRSPYGSAKVFAHHTAQNYRDSYGLWVACGVLFNHESPRRGAEFVTQKVCAGAAAIAQGRATHLALGNLDARRDWGWAPDYTRGMNLLLNAETPRDLIFATGVSHSVRDLCEQAFRTVGLDWQAHVQVDPRFIRPAEIHHLQGDPSQAEEAVGWTRSHSFSQMIQAMVQAQLR